MIAGSSSALFGRGAFNVHDKLQRIQPWGKDQRVADDRSIVHCGGERALNRVPALEFTHGTDGPYVVPGGGADGIVAGSFPCRDELIGSEFSTELGDVTKRVARHH